MLFCALLRLAASCFSPKATDRHVRAQDAIEKAMGACFGIVTVQVFFYLTLEKRNGRAPPIGAEIELTAARILSNMVVAGHLDLHRPVSRVVLASIALRRASNRVENRCSTEPRRPREIGFVASLR